MGLIHSANNFAQIKKRRQSNIKENKRNELTIIHLMHH